MKQLYTRVITRPALLLALCVVVQQFKNLSQFITGPLVNLILMVAAMAVGLGSGLCIAVLSPILAFLIAPSALMQLMPQLIALVAAGNAVLVVCAWALRKQQKLFWLGFVAGGGGPEAGGWGRGGGGPKEGLPEAGAYLRVSGQSGPLTRVYSILPARTLTAMMRCSYNIHN